MKQAWVYVLALVMVVSGVGAYTLYGVPGSASRPSATSTISASTITATAGTAPNSCGSTATSMVSAPGPVGSLWVSANLSPKPGTKACVDSVFLNTGTAPIDLGPLTFIVNITDSNGISVSQVDCNVLHSPAILTTGHTWECTAYWDAGKGPYELHVGVYSITSTEPVVAVEAPVGGSQVCISNIDSPPQSQYVSTLDQVITTPSFIQYSSGRCWRWDSTFTVSGPGYSSDTFVFDHFSNTIWYVCGLFPAFKMDARVYVVPSYSGGTVTGISIEPQGPPYATSCPG